MARRFFKIELTEEEIFDVVNGLGFADDMSEVSGFDSKLRKLILAQIEEQKGRDRNE